VVRVKLESIVSSPSCMVRTTHIVVELVTLSKVMALAACRCQPWHKPVLVGWSGDLGVRISSDSFMEWINEDNLKEFVCGIFTNPGRI